MRTVINDGAFVVSSAGSAAPTAASPTRTRRTAGPSVGIALVERLSDARMATLVLEQRVLSTRIGARPLTALNGPFRRSSGTRTSA